MAAGSVLMLSATAALVFQQTNTTTVTDQDGLNVAYAGKDRLGETDNGLVYAPRPSAEFRDLTCSLEPRPPSSELVKHELTVPEAQIRVPVGTSTDLSTLPPAPKVVRYQDSPDFGASQGTTLVAGHVDHSPGVLSPGGGELSPFGHLHDVQPCSHVYVKDSDSRTHEYVVTDIYTVPQEQIEETGVYSQHGEPRLALVTCSGPSVGDTGSKIGFTYRYNLILQAAPVEATSS